MQGDDTAEKSRAAEGEFDAGAGLSPAGGVALSFDELAEDPATGDQRFPLSSMQEQLWFLARLTPHLATDNLAFFIDAPPFVDVALLKRSLVGLLRRHEALRTTFGAEQGRPFQVVHSLLELDLPVISLENLSADERERETRQLAELQLQRPFDLERGPLLRAALVRGSGGRSKLILIIHHTVIDGFSAYKILFPELIALYDAHVANVESTLPPAKLQIRHYASWQRRRAAAGEFDEHMRYWKTQLERLPAALQLPTDRPRPRVPSTRAAEHLHLLPNALIREIRALGREERGTVFTVLLGALFALLFRYTNQEDLFVGTIVADRGSREKRSIFGPLINTIVLRANIQGSLTFRQIIRHAREVLVAALKHSELPFEMLVNELRPPRNPGQNPLFQVALNDPPQAAPSGQWAITHRGVNVGTTNLDIIFDLESTPEGTYIHAQYSTDLFDSATIQRMLEHFERLLCGAVRGPDTCLDSLPLLTDNEREQLDAWNRPISPAPGVTSTAPLAAVPISELAPFPKLFELQVERSPEAIAVIAGDEELSYMEFNAQVNRLAHRLQAVGVGPETRVSIFLERSVDMLVAILAVLKAGGAYVPMDAALPRARISFLLEDARPLVVLTQRNHLALLPGSAPVIVLDEERSSMLEESDENPDVDIRPENAAYVLYTSGSTGEPKGVVIEHRNTAAFLSAAAGWFSPEELAYVLGSTSISFDVSVFELFLPLCCGGTVVLVRSVIALTEMATQVPVTLISAVPSAITALLDTSGMPPSVRTVVLAGEALHQPLAERILELDHVRRLCNLYGPTECTTYSSAAMVLAGEVPTIGRPIAGTRLYVVDSSGGRVPVGIPGELLISGAGVARGYLNRPDLTATRFIPDPFGSGERLYKTGDLVRMRSNGDIEFIGRIDQQVKVRGFRVELGEIEAILARHPLVREVAVRKVEDASGDGRLVAYIAPEAGAERSSLAEVLRMHVRARLPAYMVPASFAVLDELPKTTSGKIDRRALLRVKTESEVRAEYVEPKTELERLIADVWRRELRVEAVSVLDNFFDVGGNSLLLVRIYDALRRLTSRPLTMLQLLSFPTIRSLAQSLSSESSDGPLSTRAQDRARRQRLALEGQRQRLYIQRRKP